MRALFYVGEDHWSGSARAFLVAARGLAKRGHEITMACCDNSRLARLATESGLETVAINRSATTAGTAWDLRTVLQERVAEVVFVFSERDQLIVSAAMRLAGRGAVIRRVPSFESVDLQNSRRLALRIADAGVLFSTEREAHDIETPGWSIPASVAPLGVDAPSYDAVRPISRADLDVPAQGILIACVYDPSGRQRLATVFRTMAFIAPRHPDLHVVVIGPGSRDEELRLHASAVGVSSVVTFMGDREDQLGVLRAANVGWVAASGDGGAFACLDLMALRIPVVAERSPLTQHYVAAGITGVLLPPGDTAHTASAVSAFLAYEDRRVAMGNAGRTRVHRDFAESATIDGFEKAGVAAADRTTWAAR
jgi:glycosyltransferase involved in cell wall biosynthesis